jgi:hypothetical protein
MKSYKLLLIFGLFLLSGIDAFSVHARYLCPGLDAKLGWQSSGAQTCDGSATTTVGITDPNPLCMTSGNNGTTSLKGVIQGCAIEFSCSNTANTSAATTSELFIYSGTALGNDFDTYPAQPNDGKGTQGCCATGTYALFPTWDPTVNNGIGACVAPTGTLSANISSCTIPTGSGACTLGDVKLTWTTQFPVSPTDQKNSSENRARSKI